uniref:Uncharacterized protein n=1 Tax=Timema tahoe TaxID=61484 RepID=A0A7R9FLW5_9NEOP|nr:unnamed protein product [Timema tahoe]
MALFTITNRMSKLSTSAVVMVAILLLSVALLGVSAVSLDACRGVVCPTGHRCVLDIKNCFAPPCPQYRCATKVRCPSCDCGWSRVFENTPCYCRVRLLSPRYVAVISTRLHTKSQLIVAAWGTHILLLNDRRHGEPCSTSSDISCSQAGRNQAF